MATNIHIKIDKIAGESVDGKHKDTIDVLAWSWGMSQAGTFHSGSGGGAGKVNVQDISITKYVDSASTKLQHACLTGEHIAKATLYVAKAGGKDPLDFLIVTLEKIMVTAVSVGSSSGEERPTENVTLNFSKFKEEYFKQGDTGTGKADGNVSWDIPANKTV